MTLLLIRWLWKHVRFALGLDPATTAATKSSPIPKSLLRRQSEPPRVIPMSEALKIRVDMETDNYRQFTESRVDQAILDGMEGKPKPGNTPSPTEQAMLDHRHQVGEVLKEVGEFYKHDLIQGLKRDQQKLGDGSIKKRVLQEVAARKQAALKQVGESLAGTKVSSSLRRLLKRYRNVAGVVAHLKEKLRQLGDAKAVADNHFHHLKQHRYAGKPPIKGLIDRDWVFWSLMIVLGWVEIFANFSSFQSLGFGDNNLAALSLAAFFAGSLAFCAKMLGSSLREGNRKQGWLYGGLCLLLCFLISGSRLSMEADIAIKGIYLLVNFLITGATALAAWYYARHHAFFTAKSQRDRLSHQIAGIEHQVEQLTAAVQAERSSIEESMELEQQMQIDGQIQELEAQIHRREADLPRIDSVVAMGDRELEKHYRNGLRDYRTLNNTIRQENGFPPITDWFNGGSGPLGRAAILLLGMSLGLTSCGEPAPPPVHIEVLYDVTSGDHAGDVESMSAFILDQLEEELAAENRNDVTVTLSAIDETSTTSLRTVWLPASQDFLSRNQKLHEQGPERFREQLVLALEELTRPGEGKHKSAIHRNLVNRAHVLVKQPGRKVILCWSDLILNEPPVSFYDYQRNPEKIGEDRDTLLAQLTRRYDMPDLSGVTLINTYQPVLVEDDIHEEAKAFFHHYWHDVKGAEVVFQTNLALPASAGELSK